MSPPKRKPAAPWEALAGISEDKNNKTENITNPKTIKAKTLSLLHPTVMGGPQ